MYAIGSLSDTRSIAKKLGYTILFIDDWNIDKNDKFIRDIIDSRSHVFLCTPMDPYAKNTTVLAREVRQLLNAGYVIKKRYMHPLSNPQAVRLERVITNTPAPT